MVVIGDIVLTAFFQTLFEKLMSDGVSQFLKLLKKGGDIQHETIVKEWKGKLLMIDALLSDAEGKQVRNRAVQKWLEGLQDLAFDMDDILDRFAIEAQLQENSEAHEEDADLDARFLSFDMVQSGFGFCSRLAQHCRSSGSDFSNKIEDINSRLIELQNQARDLRLSEHVMQQGTHLAEAPKTRGRETTSLVREPVVYGRDDKRDEIMGKLLKDEPSYGNYVVIPIVGKGGIGKTTLAQYVYNDEQLEKHFTFKAWVCVSDLFDFESITTAIINSGTNGNHRSSNLNEAQEKLMKELKGKKFLIILDDIWTEKYNDWDILRTPFHQGERGSRIIITTRSESIARMVSNNPTHSTTINLQGLSDDDCWCLFQRHTNEDPDLAEMRDDVLRKCKGLPLAVKALAGLLKSTVEKSQRREILDNNIWSEDNESEVLPALRLSYNHLKPHLKQVFAYCYTLPKDYKFQEIEVVLLWMAQGFLRADRGERMENKGHIYFHELVSRSLFERSPDHEGYFIMHDLIHDLAQWAAGDICRCVMNVKDMQRDLNRVRHLTLAKNVKVETDFENQLFNARNGNGIAPQLRTFRAEIVIDDALNIEFKIFLQRFQYVRTLFLASEKIEELPECIGNLKHLRFFDLRFSRLQVLPKSISKLCNLQTLFLLDCWDLRDVTAIGNLTRLRHLNLGYSEAPLLIGKLTNLQTLMSPICLQDGTGGAIIRELMNLNYLHGTLRIYGLEHVKKVEDAQAAQLHEKRSLDKLHLEWGSADERDVNMERNVMEQLKPHTSIKECELKGYMGLTFSAWLGDPSFENMVQIRLVDCRNLERLPPLGQLPKLKNLQIVCLYGIKEVGPEFYGNLGHLKPFFPSLTYLEFQHMRSWEKWFHPVIDHSKALFPKLERLLIRESKLSEVNLPSCLSSLKVLEIMYSPRVSLPRIAPSLEKLKLHRCDVFTITETLVNSWPKLRTVVLDNVESGFTSLSVGLPCLEELKIKHCDSLMTVNQLPVILGRLEIFGCQKLQSVEFQESSSSSSFASSKVKVTISGCESLVTVGQIPLIVEELVISYCKSLKSLWFSDKCRAIHEAKTEEGSCSSGVEGTTSQVATTSGVGVGLEISDKQQQQQLPHYTPLEIELPHLTKFCVWKCPNLIWLLDDLLLPSIKHLEFSEYEKIEALPKQMHNFTSLETLFIQNCPNIHLPKQMHNFTSLKTFCIEECPKIQQFSEGGLPRSLKTLEIKKMNLTQPMRDWGLDHLTHLQRLVLKYTGWSSELVGCIPSPDLNLPSSLSELLIRGFPNLKSVRCSSIPNLTYIQLRKCPKLETLVEVDNNYLPPSLTQVLISKCPKLESWGDNNCLQYVYIDDCPSIQHLHKPSPLFVGFYFSDDEESNGVEQ